MRANLSDLINRAEKGEEIVITRQGVPVAEIKPRRPGPKKITKADMDRLRSRIIRPAPGYPGSVELIRQMRDEGN